MKLSKEDMDKKMDEHFGYEASNDIEGVVSTLAPDVIHDIVGSPTGPTIGPEKAHAFYEKAFADFEDGKVTKVKRLYGENFLVDESVWEGTAAGKPFGIEGKGRPLKFRLLHVLEFAENGLIKRENLWVDLAAIIQQLP